MDAIRIAVHGAGGRMGRRLVALATADEQLRVVAAWEAANHPRLGEDAGVVAGAWPIGVPLTAALDEVPDVVVDFSLPEAFDPLLESCLSRRLPLVTATTGLSAQQMARREAAGRTIPLLWAPNMSLAVNLAMRLVQVAAEVLKDKDADVEILERHHRFKEDAPSGTALKFGQLVAEAMGQREHRHGRQGRPGKRPHGEIGYHAIRAGDHPGEHVVVFAMLGETIEIAVRATNRDCYAQGALAAAKFLVGKPAGTYAICDVLGLESTGG